MSSIYFSLIIACYNEGPTFEKSLEKILKVLDKIPKNNEIIFVEDKSTDKTKENVQLLLKRIKNAKAIFHERNLGRGKTVTDGILASKGKFCGFIDVDCEIAPQYIPLFLKRLETDADMVVASRNYVKNINSLNRLIASQMYKQIIKRVLKLPISDTESGYKFFNRSKILPVLKKTKDSGWFWDTEICARAFAQGLTIEEIPVDFVRRSDKRSTVRLFHDGLDYVLKLIKFSKEFNKLKNKNGS